jgi:hypothetical protein
LEEGPSFLLPWGPKILLAALVVVVVVVVDVVDVVDVI